MKRLRIDFIVGNVWTYSLYTEYFDEFRISEISITRGSELSNFCLATPVTG